MAPRHPRAGDGAAAQDDPEASPRGRSGTDAPPARPRRTRGQRLLLGLGIVASFAAFAAAVTAGWLAWKYHQIDRTDVKLADAGDGPVNYLIVGSDTRSKGDPNDPRARDDHKPLADTIMILRIDAQQETAKILSLPRDLWVRQSGTGQEGRINAAYATGGPQRLVDTLHDALHIPINHYVEVDFAGFQKVVTAVDGVPMWFDRAMRDRNSGLDVLHPGCTVLDGYGALGFARARHLEYYDQGTFHYDGTGDLGRISRQQLFIRRLIDRAKSKGIRNPLTLKRLVDAGVGSVTLDEGMDVSEVIGLGERFADFDSTSLVSYTLPATPRTTSGGAAVLDLDEAGARPILDQFRDPAQAAKEVADENARRAASTTSAPRQDLVLWVLNSSGRAGLASGAATSLEGLGYTVDHWGNGSELDHGTESRTTVRYGEGADGLAGLIASSVRSGAKVVSDPSLKAGRVVLYLGGDFTSIGKPTVTTTTAGSSTTVAPTTTTTAPPSSKVIGMVPGDPPPGRHCG